jgi:hypothetical protein
MKEKIKNIGYILFGIGIFIGIILLSLIFLKGGLWLSLILYPIISFISVIVFAICIIILLPLGIFRKTRTISGIGLLISSYIFGATTWIWSFLLAYILWGFVGLFVGLFMGGIGVVPIAILATIFSGEWVILGQLLLSIIFVFGFRFLAIYISSKAQ